MQIPQQSDRAFGLTFSAVFAIIFAAGWLIFGVVAIWSIAVSAVFLILALGISWLLMPLNRLWSKFANRTSKISNFIFLGLFFYLFIFPFGLILRLFAKDSMDRTWDAKSQSYWTPVSRNADAKTFKDMF